MSTKASSQKQRKMKEPFTQEEDSIIFTFVMENGISKISELNSMLPSRTVRQIRERYRLYLDPNVIQTSFSNEEDAKLMELVDKYGQQWSKLASMFNGRTDVQLKYRFKKLTRRLAKRRPNLVIKEITQCQNIQKRESIVQQNVKKFDNQNEEKTQQKQICAEKDHVSEFTYDDQMFHIVIENLKDLDFSENSFNIEKFDLPDFYPDNYDGSMFDDSSFN
jgi:hypothetical protein